MGQSFLGSDLFITTCSNVPAHSSLLVKKLVILKTFFKVAEKEEASYSLSSNGPNGLLTTVYLFIQGEIIIVGILTPILVKLKGGLVLFSPSGLGTFKGVGT